MCLELSVLMMSVYTALLFLMIISLPSPPSSRIVDYNMCVLLPQTKMQCFFSSKVCLLVFCVHLSPWQTVSSSSLAWHSVHSCLHYIPLASVVLPFSTSHSLKELFSQEEHERHRLIDKKDYSFGCLKKLFSRQLTIFFNIYSTCCLRNVKSTDMTLKYQIRHQWQTYKHESVMIITYNE